MKPDVNRLKFYRTQAGMTQEQLALSADVRLTTIQKIERGVTDIAGIRLETAFRLAVALGISVENLLFDPEEEE